MTTKFIETMEYILDFMTRDFLKQIKQCFADKGYISRIIQEYLENQNVQVHIPIKKNSIERRPKKRKSKIKSVRFVVEQFFGWLKNKIVELELVMQGTATITWDLFIWQQF